MNKMRYALLIAGVVTLGACDKSGTDAVLASTPPLAYTRFINAVADTGASDWHFIDQVEYSPLALGMAFRTFSPYQGTAPGSRKLRIFLTSTNIAVTSVAMKDTTFTLEAGKYYSIIYAGYARTGQTPSHRVLVMEDPIPTSVTATQIASRAVNLASGLGALDAYAVDTITTAIGATPMFSNIAYGGASTYNTAIPTGRLAFRVTANGSTTVLASAQAPPGSPADALNNLTAIAGYSIGGSVFSAYVFPRSVAGSTAPQTTAFTSPAVVYLYDRHPR